MPGKFVPFSAVLFVTALMCSCGGSELEERRQSSAVHWTGITPEQITAAKALGVPLTRRSVWYSNDPGGNLASSQHWLLCITDNGTAALEIHHYGAMGGVLEQEQVGRWRVAQPYLLLEVTDLSSADEVTYVARCKDGDLLLGPTPLDGVGHGDLVISEHAERHEAEVRTLKLDPPLANRGALGR